MVRPHQTREVIHDGWLVFKRLHYGMDFSQIELELLGSQELSPFGQGTDWNLRTYAWYQD